MKLIKRFFLFVFVLLFLLVVAAVAIPYFYKDEIIALVKEEANKQVNAKVDFQDVNLSILWSFPDFTLGLEELTVDGVDEFEGVRLAEIDNFNLTLDLYSVINSDQPLAIKSVNLIRPNLNIQVLPSGKANYDIAKVTETVMEEEDINSEEDVMIFLLDRYSIKDGQLIYNDRAGATYVKIEDLNHIGKGDFTSTVYDLDTETSMNKLTARYDGITYLSKAKTSLDAIFNIDLSQNKYTLKDNDLKVNALQVKADGFVQLLDDAIDMDLTYSAPSNEFKHFLSLIPGAYIEGYEDVKANGIVKLDGFVKGRYQGNNYPAFKVNLDLKNGDFKYPDLPMGVDKINTVVSINSPSSNLDAMTIDIPQFAMNLAQNPFEATLKLATPISDPAIDTKVKGIINLQDFAKAFPVEGVKAMEGLIRADFAVNTKMSHIDQAAYDKVDMSGDLRITDMDYIATDMPPVRINDLRLDFSPQYVNMPTFDAQLGKSDIKADGRIDNILAYIAPDKTMKGTFKVRSANFDANEWMPAEETTETAAPTTPSSEETAASEEVFDRFDFTLDAKIGRIIYDVYEIKEAVAKGHFTPSKLSIDEYALQIGDSDMSGKGTITNVWNYLFANETLGGDITFVSNYMDLNQFMTPTEDAGAKPIKNEEEALEPILIPDNINMNIDANIKELIYTNMDLKDMKGQLVVANEQVRIEDASANTLGGNFAIEGGYNTQDAEKPTFDLAYTLKRLDVQKAFKTFNTFQAVAPIGKFIEGRFNSTLKMSGVLGQDMMPDLNTLSADGFMETLDAVLRNFKPLEAVGNQLDMNFFKSMNLKNSKNRFEIKDGAVIVRDIKQSIKGIDMDIDGTHGITQESMDYKIAAKIPRNLLQNNAVGAAANKGLDFLKSKASGAGINLDVGEFVNVLINLTGSITNPKVKFNVLGTDGETLTVKDVVNNVKDQVIDSLNTIKEEKIEEIKEDFSAKKAELTKEMNERADKIMADAKSAADKAKNQAVALADKGRDEAHALADREVEKVKNPLKKLAAQKVADLAKKKADETHQKAIQKANDTHANALKKAEDRADAERKKYQAKIDALGN